MKRFLRMISAAALAVCCLVLSGSINAKAAEEANIIYAQVPSDWENPCVWAWDADGNSAFESWPGEAMEADVNNDGWYFLYVPAEMTNVIINANEGGVQTTDMSTEGKNAWITINSPEDATITNEQQTDGDLPEYVKKFTMYAKVDDSWSAPCAWAWSAPDGTNVFPAWPGEEMKANTDGFYSIKLPEWVNSVIVNANEGTVQTEDISVEAKDLWLVIDEEGAYELSYEKPEASAEDLITVHATVPSDWLLPCIWAWSAPDGTNVFPNWPGQELEENGAWYEYQVPNWVNSIIINGNLGAVQTTDVSVDTGKDVWLVVKGPEEFELFYEEPNLDETSPVAEAPASEEAPAPVVEETTTGLGAGAIAGIVIAAIAIIALIAGLVISKKKSK